MMLSSQPSIAPVNAALPCLQEEVTERTLTMLRGAMAYRISHPVQLATDIGPVIDSEVQQTIEQHIKKCDKQGKQFIKLSNIANRMIINVDKPTANLMMLFVMAIATSYKLFVQ
ncbi:MAG: hypothetical protein ACL7BU_13080 [Candidatus Phlomobacter fragariae]